MYTNSPTTNAQGPPWKWSQIECKNQRVGRSAFKCCLGHDKAKAIMIPQQLQLHAQELHKTKPFKIPAQMSPPGPFPYRKLLVMENHSLLRVWPLVGFPYFSG